MKHFIKYFILISVTAFAANYIYVLSGLYKIDVSKCNGDLIYHIDSLSEQKEILYFAESSNFTTAEGDSSKESISEILNRKLNKNNLGSINQSASHAENYKKLIFRLKNKKVNTIIVTMNLRSFGINWIESKLETNLSRTNIIYSDYPPIIKKFMLAFKAYDNKEIFQREQIIRKHYKKDVIFDGPRKFKTVRDWDSYMFSKGHVTASGERDAAKCDLGCHYIKNYAFIINENNPRIKDFDEIAAFCAKNKIKLVFNLLSENYEKAKELCGEDLFFLMQKNVSFLENRYKPKSVFINNFTALKDSNFIDKLWPTEHYNFEGRNSIASNLAFALESNKDKK